MSTSELVNPTHLKRKAVIYVRQSSPHQVMTNQESLQLQYALKQRAIELGWHEQNIQTIDCDLGISGRNTEDRQGFQQLLTEVTLEKVGIILSYEVTRLSRNCSDWYPLLDICGYRQCLIGDRDGIYDPSTINGRMLLGLKGQLSEIELHTIRGRLTAGILNKAKRGELALKLPVGLVRDQLGRVYKDPNIEVQQRIEMIFDTFIKLGSASKTVRFFNRRKLHIPRHDHFGDLVWRKPTVAAVLSTLKDPAYSGTFVYGRTRAVLKGNSAHERCQKPIPMEEWKVKLHDIYPAYITWHRYEKIQAMIKDNYAEYGRNKSRGIPRPGKALLHGLVYCGECGHKMVVQYKGSTHYLCNHLRQQYQEPVCQFIPADPIDDRVVAAFFEALSPAEIDLYAETIEAKRRVHEATFQAHQKQIERLRYQARLAERQFNQVDPDNRLVAAELESRWEAALQELQSAQTALDLEKQKQAVPQLITRKMKTAMQNVGAELPSIWNSQVNQAQKKAFLRSLIDKVVIQRTTRDNIHTRIVWRGGEVSVLDIPIHVGAFSELASSEKLEQAIITMAKAGISDADIASQLSQEGFRSPMKAAVLPSTVQTIRLQHRILRSRSQSHPKRFKGYLTVPQVAKAIGVSRHWIYDRINNGSIAIQKDETRNLYLFPDNPETMQNLHDLKKGKVQQTTSLKGASR